MGDDAVTRLTYQLLVDAQQAIANYKAAADSADQYNAAIQRIEVSSDTSAGAATKVKVVLKDTGDAAKQAAPGVNQFVQGLAGIATAVIGALSIQKVIAFLTDAGNAALDFSQALFKMDISVRALQRNGMDTTLQSWTDEIKTLGDQFQVFSNIDIANALGQSALMGREFGLTQDQMVELTKTAMIFSEVTGRDLTGAIQAVTYFIDTGYTKSIRGLGVAISQSVLAQRALDMGFVQAYKDLEPVQQAQVRFAELTAQTNVLVKDSGLYLETWAGKMAKASTDAKNAMTDLGKTVEPWMVGIQKDWAGLIKFLSISIPALEKIFSGVVAAIVGLAAGAIYSWNALMDTIKGHGPTLEEFAAGLHKALSDAAKATITEFYAMFGLLDETAKDALINQQAAEQQYATNLKQFDADVSQINSDYHDKEVTENTAFQRKMDDLNLKYTRDLSQINLDFDRREAAARTSAQNDQLSKEEAFQEKLLELREKYLYNLDDAVRARDARKVLDLNRQYNLELLQEQRQHAIEKKDAEENLKYQMALLEQERKQRLADRALQLAQDRADAKAAHEQKLADMKLEEQQKLQDLLTGFLAENHITEQGMQQIYDIIKKYVGPGGLVEGLYKYLRDYMAQAAANISINYAALSKVTATPIKGGGIAGYAEGGSVVATQPTAAIFGEAGPEMATFTPLNRPGADVNKVNGTLPKSGSGGKATISINLGAGLVGQIVDNAMGEVATVLLNAEG
jgi:hypothetical protein